MKPKLIILLALAAVGSTCWLGCGRSTKVNVEFSKIEDLAGKAFASGAMAMMYAIREDPAIAELDGPGQFEAAKRWWRKHHPELAQLAP